MDKKSLDKKEGSSISIPLKQGSEMQITVQGRQVTPNAATGLVYLLIDCSVSMSGGSKLRQAKDGAKKFAKDAQRKGYRIGLIAFSSNAICLFDPRLGNINFILHLCIDGMITSGDTNMTDAIEMAIKKLGPVGGSRAMLIATDGMPNNQETALKAAQKAKDMGITILTVGTDDANVGFLRQLATSKELAVKVVTSQFKGAIGSMALALPERAGH